MHSDAKTISHDLMQKERQLFAELLVIIAEKSSFRVLMRKLAQLLQDWSGCQAVGIRLRRGEDYPYYVIRGFPHEFVLAETELCERNAEGILIRDRRGKASLACMCGAVIEGRTDPARPFFTEFGSFWTNSTSELLAAAGQSGRLGPTRNRCNREGYESVALVPLRVEGGTFGLIQFNDQREGMFSAELIAFFERLSAGIALAIGHRLTNDALKQSEKAVRSLYKKTPAMLHSIDREGRLIETSDYWLQKMGYTRKEVIGRKVTDFLTPASYEKAVKQNLPLFFKTGSAFDVQYQFVKKNGTLMDVLLSAVAEKGPDGQMRRSLAIVTDITERKLALNALNRKERELQQKADSLEELNVALKVLIERREKEKASIEKNILLNVRNLVAPLLKRLEDARNLDEVAATSQILKKHVSELTDAFSGTLAAKKLNLTNMEYQVAKLIQEGKSSREMADIFHISPKAIAFHRNNIRRKLGLTHQKINLQTYLKSLD